MAEQMTTVNRPLSQRAEHNVIKAIIGLFEIICQWTPSVTSRQKSRLRLIWIYDQMASESLMRGDIIGAIGHERCAEALRG